MDGLLEVQVESRQFLYSRGKVSVRNGAVRAKEKKREEVKLNSIKQWIDPISETKSPLTGIMLFVLEPNPLYGPY